ncbi:MAG: hypothetical protein L0H79_14590 [Intrasporangium sp.]|uniref:hypothetical protein n=1 Tax=Intrasporangium sp. TaxID=1925024 RepID=UPI0026490BDC|nr:hypothetical protein [Intrasporangium sp.]MDN5796970.1 hypothetical protein [Intrasporangium sp.]
MAGGPVTGRNVVTTSPTPRNPVRVRIPEPWVGLVYRNCGITHWSLQVVGCGDCVADFANYLAEHPHSLAGAAYLHNATDHAVSDLFAL